MRTSSPESREGADLAACRAALSAGSKSFAAAARLLPASVRDDATVLYAFCREADDVIDESGGDHAIQHLRARLDAVYRGHPLAHSADRVLTAVVTRHSLPRALLDALIEGFEWDADNRSYNSLAGLEAYAARVAGTVGAMMAVLMGVRAPEALARACDLGIAMQYTNIARDVGEDARRGRLYLPLDWMREAGLDPQAFVSSPNHDDRIAKVVRRLLDTADELYARVASGIDYLPPECRPGIHAARLIYADIGRELRRQACDSVSRRAVVTPARKLWLLLRAYVPAAAAVPRESRPALSEAAFLIDAVSAAAAPRTAMRAAPELAPQWWHFRSRALWLIDLFERLERRERDDGCDAIPDGGA